MVALRKWLVAQNAKLIPILNLIPKSATDDQIYFYIWAQDESIAELVPVPKNLNEHCVEMVRNWIIADVESSINYGSLLKLRPLAYKTTHFEELIKYSTNRNKIFTAEAIKKIETVLGFKTPKILTSLLDKLKSYPVYQQYALVIAYFLHIGGAFYNKSVFINFICDGPAPPRISRSARANWAKWASTVPRITIADLGQEPTPLEKATLPKLAYTGVPNTIQPVRSSFSISSKRQAPPNIPKKIVASPRIDTQEAIRKQREEEAATQKQREEATKKKREEETARKHREEEIARKKCEEEERKKQEEEIVRKKCEEEERKKQEEEIARKKCEEAERKKQEEEIVRKKCKEEERKKQEEEIARKKCEEKASVRKHREEEIARKKCEEEKASARKHREEEAAARKRREEEKCKRREEDAARTRREETERKQREEKARKRREEEEAAALKRREEEAAAQERHEEVARKKCEEAAAKKRCEEEECKRREEDAARKRCEEIEKSRRREEAMKKQRDEVEAASKRRKEEETESKRRKEAEVASKQRDEIVPAGKQRKEPAAVRKQREEEVAKKYPTDTEKSLNTGQQVCNSFAVNARRQANPLVSITPKNIGWQVRSQPKNIYGGSPAKSLPEAVAIQTDDDDTFTIYTGPPLRLSDGIEEWTINSNPLPRSFSRVSRDWYNNHSTVAEKERRLQAWLEDRLINWLPLASDSTHHTLQKAISDIAQKISQGLSSKYK